MNLNELRDRAHQINQSKGFGLGDVDIPRALCSIHSEVSEALEADRADKTCPLDAARALNSDTNIDEEEFIIKFENRIKNTLADELADIIIRTASTCASLDIDIEAHVQAKLHYNTTRPHKHGGKKY